MGSISLTNGDGEHLDRTSKHSRASELETLLRAVIEQSIPFVSAADEEAERHIHHKPVDKSALVEYHSPEDLTAILSDVLHTPSEPLGERGFREALSAVLKSSVNTCAPGFMDKLYSAPVPPGIAADLILSILNTNLHVYQVSPVLTLVEKHVTKSLASLFGFTGPRAGGINVQGGSASNMTAISIARNTLYPATKLHGNSVDGLDLVLFTSAHGHYSIEKAAQQCGFGSAAVISVPVDPVTGGMIPAELERLVHESKSRHKTPFFVNATAGTTVLGSFDPFVEIAAVARRHNMWLHIDGAWGGTFAFSPTLRQTRLRGSHLADSLAINPHKMMGIPVTCSFLLARDLKQFHDANTLRAGYLFHDADDEPRESRDITTTPDPTHWREPHDLADMTPQCGRRGDSLKLHLAWRYYGTSGYRARVDAAHAVARHLADLVARHPDLRLVSQNPPPCLQVCFHYAPHKRALFACADAADGQIAPPGLALASAADEKSSLLDKYNSKVTERIARGLVSRGFMVDFAPALEGHEARGTFLRAVVNIQTPRETVERLVAEVARVGSGVVTGLRSAV